MQLHRLQSFIVRFQSTYTGSPFGLRGMSIPSRSARENGKNRINSRLPVAQHYSVAPRPRVISSYTLTGLICRITSPRATTKLTRKLQLSMTVKRFSVQCSLQHDICPSFDCPPAVEAHLHCIECNQGYSIPIVIIP